MAETWVNKLIAAFIAALTTSGVVTAMLFAAWAIYGIVGGGFRNANDILTMFSYAMALFVVSTAVFTAYFALARK